MTDSLIIEPVVNEITVIEDVNEVIVSSVGVQGAKGDKGDTGATGATGSSGVIAVTAPITNNGTSTAANIGIDTSNFALKNAANTFTGGVQQITTANSATKGLIVKATASQSANLQEWQDSAGTILSQVAANGSVRFGTATTMGTVLHTINGANSYFALYNSNTSLYYGLSAQLPSPSGTSTLGGYYAGLGIGGSTHNTSTPIFGVATIATGAENTVPFIVYDNGATITRSLNSNITPLKVQGAASQTAHLQQWINSSGTILASITAAGAINFAASNTATTATAGAITPPALVTGYITMQIAGTTVKVPYYSN